MSNATYADIRRAMRRFPWEDFLQNVGLDVTLRDIEVGGECPWCHWKRQSFYLNVDKGVYKCHYCGKSGWAIEVVAQVMRSNTSEAIDRVLEHRVSVYENDPWEEDEVELAPEPEEPPPSIEIPREFYPLADNTSRTARPYLRYARSRMTDEQIARYGVGYCDSGRYAGRILVPVQYAGRLVTFVARSIDPDAKKKVDTPPGNEQYSYLFNLEHVWGQALVIITEGVFDVMPIDSMAVATFGKQVTAAQTLLLANAGVNEVVIAWDADAQKDIWDAYLRCSARFDKVTAITLPEGEDPSSLGRDGVLELLQKRAAPTMPFAAMRGAFGDDGERLKI